MKMLHRFIGAVAFGVLAHIPQTFAQTASVSPAVSSL